MSDPIASIYLRVQSFWFGARSKPGLQSQATPPLGVSRQMWAQPWSLFMQFIPSGKRQTREGLGIRGERKFKAEKRQPMKHHDHMERTSQPERGPLGTNQGLGAQVWSQASLREPHRNCGL